MTDILVGLETLEAGRALPRHRHVRAYAAIILDGSYEEAGTAGRIRAEAGDVVVHDRFSAHLDQIGGLGARTLNLHLGGALEEGVFQVDGLDEICALARSDRALAAQQLGDRLHTGKARTNARQDDWPDQLAETLSHDAHIRLDAWAGANDLAPATVSRGFARAYGVTPRAFRSEARSRLAWSRIMTGADSLADLAADLGFADQAHMTRSVAALTGLPPGAWRRSSEFKTGPAP